MGLGSFKLVTLAEARDIAFENRKEARIHKRDPLAEMRKAKIPTFREAAMRTYDALKPNWRSGKHTKNWLQIMEKYAIPIIGSVRIDKLGREDVLKILTPLWTKRPETARRLRQKMRATFNWAQAHGFTRKQPCRRNDRWSFAETEGCKGTFSSAPLPGCCRRAGDDRAVRYNDR